MNKILIKWNLQIIFNIKDKKNDDKWITVNSKKNKKNKKKKKVFNKEKNKFGKSYLAKRNCEPAARGGQNAPGQDKKSPRVMERTIREEVAMESRKTIKKWSCGEPDEPYVPSAQFLMGDHAPKAGAELPIIWGFTLEEHQQMREVERLQICRRW